MNVVVVTDVTAAQTTMVPTGVNATRVTTTHQLLIPVLVRDNVLGDYVIVMSTCNVLVENILILRPEKLHILF